MKPAMLLLSAFLSLTLGILSSLGAEPQLELQVSAQRVQVKRGELQVEFDAAGRGLFTRASRAKAEIGAASPSSGIFASLLIPKGAESLLEPVRGEEVIGKVEVSSVKARKVQDQVETQITGRIDFQQLGAGPFLVTVLTPSTGPALASSVELQVPEQARRCSLASFGLAIPLTLAFQPNSKMGAQLDRSAAAAILPRAGTPIPEVRYLVAEQDQTSVWGPMLWTLAGIHQVAPRSMEVWEAWSAVSPRFILQQHQVHPGWMAVADQSNVVAVAMPGIERIAPKEIFVDSAARVLRICFQSPHDRPLDLSAAPSKLAAGPAYVFFEPADVRTRRAEAYLETKNRLALAALGQQLATLSRTECNFSGMQTVERKPRREIPLLPADPEFSSHAAGPVDAIPIWVDEPQGKDLDALPITRGVPLARGILKDEKKAALEDEAGRPVPCAARALAFWPDGSIKWLLLDFQGQLKAGVGAKFRLVIGDRAQPRAIAHPLEITESTNEVSVDTGKLRLTLTNRERTLALSVSLDLNGNGKIEENETILSTLTNLLGCRFSHVEDSANYVSGTWRDPGRDDPGEPEVTELRVEERSPLRAVLLVRANLKHHSVASTIPAKNRPPGGTPITLRLHLFANSSLVRLQHTFMFAGDVRHDFLRDLGVRLPLTAGALTQFRTSIDGTAVSLAARGTCGVLQESPDSVLVWHSSGNQGRIEAAGQAADGWLEAQGERWGVTVGLPHMRERFPREIQGDEGGIWTYFYSPHAAPMDVRRYACKYGDGESTSTGFGSAFGALRTHEACWSFYPVGADSAGLAQAQAMLEPPLARVRPRYVADTLAVGHTAEFGAPTSNQHFDAVLYHLPRMHQHNREFWRWFGFWNYGDEIQVYDAGKQRWAVDDGRYGWYNNEPVREYNYHLAFLMTGHRRIWEQAQAMSYHVFEVDVRHANPQPFMSAADRLEKQDYTHSTTQGIDLCGRRHNCQHWADGYFGPRIGSPPGFRLCYYQTGDPVMREYLARLVASALGTRRSQYMAADGDEAVLWAMITGYELTRDSKYLERIRAYADLQVEFARAHNGFPAAQANWDWAGNRAGAPPSDPRDDLWIWSFGGHLALIEAADILGNPALEQMLCNWVLALEGFGPDKKRRDSWANNVGSCPLLAYYYRRTGDPRALEWFEKRAKSFHSSIPRAAPATDLPVDTMESELPVYTPNDGSGWVYTIPTFWYVGIPNWQGALRTQGGK